ncbi:hypothetical protein DESA109040_06215 [Deinococcus saxicola]
MLTPRTVRVPLAVVARARVCPSVNLPPVSLSSLNVAFGNSPVLNAPFVWLSRRLLPVFSPERGTLTVPVVAARSSVSRSTALLNGAAYAFHGPLHVHEGDAVLEGRLPTGGRVIRIPSVWLTKWDSASLPTPRQEGCSSHFRHASQLCKSAQMFIVFANDSIGVRIEGAPAADAQSRSPVRKKRVCFTAQQ